MSDDKQLATSPRAPRVRADAARRAAEAWQMRVSGYTWVEIADRLGMKGGAPTAHHAVTNYFGVCPR